MLSTEVAAGPIMGKVFTVFFAFWGVALVVLWIAVSLLQKKKEQLMAKNSHGH
jgi:hypothetical protein